MTVEDCYQLGYIIKPHGLKGEVQIFLDVDKPREYNILESVFVLQGQNLVPFFLESISINGERAIVKFEEIDDIEAAKSIKALELYMPLDTLPELEEDEFYFHELSGYSLIDEVLGLIGEVESVVDAGSQNLLNVKHASGKEILVPLTKELIVELDKVDKKLLMKIPEGLVDVYLNE